MMPLTIRTPEQIEAEALGAHKARVVAAIDAHVEAQAQAMDYNGAAHLASYVASGVAEWAAEAQAFVAWRDAVWLMVVEAQESDTAAHAPSRAEEIIRRLPRIEDFLRRQRDHRSG